MKLSNKYFAAPEGSLAAGAAEIMRSIAEGEAAPTPEPEKAVEEKPGEEAEAEKETKPAEDDIPETLPNEGRNERWKGLRTQYKATKDELSKARQDLAEFEGTRKERDELKQRITDLEQEKTKWSEIDTISKLERSPGFQEQFTQPRAKAAATLKELAGYADVDVNALTSALAKSGKERFQAVEDVLTSVPGTLRGKIERTIETLDDLDSRMAGEREHAEQSIQQREQTARQKAAQQREEYVKNSMAIFDETARGLGKEYGLDEATIQKARKAFAENQDMGEASRLIVKAHAYDHKAAETGELKKQLAEIQEELKRLKKASPGVGGGAGGERSGGAPKSFLEGALASIRG